MGERVAMIWIKLCQELQAIAHNTLLLASL
jgi:hypothetical protein